jgi:hypothetical protein
MSSNAHGVTLGNSTANHVADCRPAEVVEELSAILRLSIVSPFLSAFGTLATRFQFNVLAVSAIELPKSGHDTGSMPSLAEIAYCFAVTMEDQVRENNRMVRLLDLASAAAPFNKRC